MHKEKKMKKGESRWISNGSIAAFYFKDRSKVNFLTNYDGMGLNLEKKIPEIIACYRKNMGNVDRADSILSNCIFSHRNRKWTDANFKTCFKMTIDNSWIIYKKVKNSSISLEEFMRILAVEMVNQFEPHNTHIGKPVNARKGKDYHFPVNTGIKKNCQVMACKKNKSKSPYKCSECDVHLHIDCFQSFHTSESKK